MIRPSAEEVRNAGMPDSLQRVIALGAAVLTLPLVALLALAVRLDSPGPALYVSRRVGAGGRIFTCFKIRTLSSEKTGGARITHGTDQRITRVGAVLRRTRLDELPQLWNVVRGEMRLVGPRPEDPAFVDLADPLHAQVFAGRPGITGLTQILYSDEADRLRPDDPEGQYRAEILPTKLRIDAAYLRHRSSALDIWILARTPRAARGRPVGAPAWLAAELAAEPTDPSIREAAHAAI